LIRKTPIPRSGLPSPSAATTWRAIWRKPQSNSTCRCGPRRRCGYSSAR
jgi:hypothetical protein